MSHVTQLRILGVFSRQTDAAKSEITYEWSHVTHMNESCHTQLRMLDALSRQTDAAKSEIAQKDKENKKLYDQIEVCR